MKRIQKRDKICIFYTNIHYASALNFFLLTFNINNEIKQQIKK